MTIEQLGSLGELIAAVATVATLVYLAVQIHQNTRMVAASVAQAHRDARNEVTRILGDNPEAARIYREGLLDLTGLSQADRYQFDALMTLSLNYYEQAHSQGDLEALLEQNQYMLAQPGLHAWWKELGRGNYSDSFCSLFEAWLATAQPAAQQGAAADSA